MVTVDFRASHATLAGDLWWKTAVIYCLDVQTFYDSNGDGIGDFAGLSERLDHLVDLGVTVVWLLPFYPTADVDDGYDITDFYTVDPRLGSLGDFAEFVRTAKACGLKVIADLVPESPGDVVFPDQETSIWTKDRKAGQYYLHRFYRSQPDLNVTNPAVRNEISKIIGFWMELGLSGFRVDAVPFLLETTGISGGAAALPRPPTMLDGDQRRIRMVYSLMLSLPGTPTLFYGEEVGMAENLDLPGRMAVRTPMQWQPGALGGFSTAPSADRLCRPFPAGRFGPDEVNVVGQRHDPESLLSFIRQRIRGYRECPELGWGVVTILDHDVRSVLAHRCDWSGSTVLLCHNLGSAAETVRLTLVDQHKGVRCAEPFHAADDVTVGEGGVIELKLEAYAARWFRLITDRDSALV